MKGLLKRSRRPVEERSDPQTITIEGLARQFVLAYGSGASITVDKAVRNAAVWACVRVLTATASGLPVDGVRKDGTRRVPVDPSPQLLVNPSAMVAPDVWRAQVFWSMFTDGNAFGRITQMSRAKYPLTVETLDAGCVTDRRTNSDGQTTVRVDGGSPEGLYPWGDIWHVPGVLVKAGSPFALSPVEYAARSINAAISAEDFGSDFMTAGGHPSALLQPETDPGPVAARAMKEAFIQAAQSREPAVLPQHVTYEQIQVNPDDSQFIELLRFEVENACRFFGVPPSMVYASVSGQSVTYANVSQADLHYLKHSIDTPLVRFEGALTRCLPRPQFAVVNRGALLRADAAARAAEHAIRLNTKTRTVNEVRALEDEEPFTDPEFDKPGIPGGATAAPDTAPATGGM